MPEQKVEIHLVSTQKRVNCTTKFSSLDRATVLGKVLNTKPEKCVSGN